MELRTRLSYLAGFGLIAVGLTLEAVQWLR